MTGPFRDPAGSDDTQPDASHPFGYGRWRCPKCGVYAPRREVLPLTLPFDEYLRLKHIGLSGCYGVWRTRTWEQEKQVIADRQRTIAAENARKPAPENSPQWTWGSLYTAIMLSAWAALGSETVLRGLAIVVAFCAFGAWWNRR